jgi:hypothetical protein
MLPVYFLDPHRCPVQGSMSGLVVLLKPRLGRVSSASSIVSFMKIGVFQKHVNRERPGHSCGPLVHVLVQLCSAGFFFSDAPGIPRPPLVNKSTHEEKNREIQKPKKHGSPAPTMASSPSEAPQRISLKTEPGLSAMGMAAAAVSPAIEPERETGMHYTAAPHLSLILCTSKVYLPPGCGIRTFGKGCPGTGTFQTGERTE